MLAFSLILGVQSIDALQNLELRAFDKLLLQRTENKIDSRIVIIGETEPDIKRFGYPLSNDLFSDVLQKIEQAGARVIGVDKYRDFPILPDTGKLNSTLQTYQNIVWIFFASSIKENFISAPAILNANPERTGFNNVIEDSDGVTRRSILFMDANDNTYYSFSLLLALHYLAAENIMASSDKNGAFNLNQVSFPKMDASFGAYHNVDAGFYQIMQEYPALTQSFTFFTISDLWDNKIPENALKNKIVLIGGTANSLSDYRLLPDEIRRFGVEHHAYMVSQLLKTAIEQKTPLRAWTDKFEFFWLAFWCFIGGFTGFKRGNLLRLCCLMTLEIVILFTITFLLFFKSIWIPIIAPLFGWISALIINILYFSSLERAERGQLMQLFASHVSPEVARKLWEMREQFFNEGGVRPDTLTATVLFTDITNFTPLAEKVPPLILMRWLNEYMSEMTTLVTQHGGMVNKYIGDGMMAVFGVPVKRETPQEIENDAKNAVQCAVLFNEKLQMLNQKWKEQGLPTITMRVGIYTGSLVAGSFGGILRTEYTVIGDTVNIASRLECFEKTISTPTLNCPTRILIGQTTYDYVHFDYKTQVVGEYQLKGKEAYSKIYQIITS